MIHDLFLFLIVVAYVYGIAAALLGTLLIAAWLDETYLHPTPPPSREYVGELADEVEWHGPRRRSAIYDQDAA